ncbi:MAG: hypothetical protein WDA07_13280 [Leucobacter sp.]
MRLRIWELHSQRLSGGIVTTPEGDADVGGLVLSEKAYLLVVRDVRPQQLIDMVRRDGPGAIAHQLIAHFSTADAVAASGGRTLVAARGMSGGPCIRRSDEVAEPATPHL